MVTNATMLPQMICKRLGYLTSSSIGQNPYALAPTVILQLQLVVISMASRMVDHWLRRLGQISVVSQIIAGILLGPSLLGQNDVLERTLFPPDGYVTLATLAGFGNMFYHFLIAVRQDPVMILRPGRVPMFIATVAFTLTMVFSIVIAVVLKKYIEMNQAMQNAIVLIAMTQAFTGISVVSFLITELKLQNTDIGRLALAIAVFTDLLNVFTVTMLFAANDKITNHRMMFLWAVLTTLGVAFFIVLVIRRVILTIINLIPTGKPVDHKYVSYIVLTTIILGFVSEVIGQHYLFGPAILGLVVPEGPPLGAALVSRLDTFVSGFLYPMYLAISGLQTNIFTISVKEVWILGTVVIFGMVIKTGAVMSAGMYMNLTPKDAFVLSMILNSKGILEISIFNFWKENKLLQTAEFSLCILSVVVTTAIITPLVRFLYDPTKQPLQFWRSTIQHSNQYLELRMLVCIHNSENVPALVNLLEISKATEQSCIAVTALVLTELVGRSVPVLFSNDNEPRHNEKAAASRIINAFRTYEQKNEGWATMQSFTSISSYDTMHLDICRLAADKRSSILIVPFHKKWAIDGNIESANTSIRRMNCNLLEKAPCSVGILVDRAILKGSLIIITSQMKFHVAVIFLGGPDDAESLAYAARMARHESVILTVIRFLLFGDENSLERKRDSELIFQYKQANVGNEQFLYVEEVVRDGLGLSQCIGKLVNYFDLILVGRYHQDSPIFTGLEAWSECPELGVIGDMLASPDFKTTASVLVIQQQRIRVSKRERQAHLDPDNISQRYSRANISRRYSRDNISRGCSMDNNSWRYSRENISPRYSMDNNSWRYSKDNNEG